MNGYPNYADAGGSYESLTRMLWGLGGWLSQPDRTSTITWRGETYDIEAITRRALVNGCDPESPAFWGIEYDPSRSHDQRTVETGQIAFALWQSRARIWDKLSDTEQTNIYNFLERFARPPVTKGNNWSLFWVLNHACRKSLGMPYDQSIIDEITGDYLDRVYCEDGWYDDAPQKGVGYFDDYNLWVFGSHVLAWAQVDGHHMPDRRDELLARIGLFMDKVPYFFAENGAYSEYGRSLAYKFARLGAPLWAYKLGVWSHSPGLLRRLVGRHLRWYVDRGAIRNDGTLRQSLTAAGSPEIVERYISTGATYWAMQAFGGLWSLSDGDVFWTEEETQLPAETENYLKVYPQPGWILRSNNGHVERFNAGSLKGMDAKYAKFVYSTQFPFNVGMSNGMPAPDNMLSLTDGAIRGQRSKNLAFAVDESGWLRFRWEQDLNGNTHTIETVIVLQDGVHIRAHKIELAPEQSTPISAIEGCAPLGYDVGGVPIIRTDEYYCAAGIDNQMVVIANLDGYDRATFWQGQPGINSVYACYVLPVVTVETVTDGLNLLCWVHHGSATNQIVSPDDINGQWQDDGTFHLATGDAEIVVPSLT